MVSMSARSRVRTPVLVRVLISSFLIMTLVLVASSPVLAGASGSWKTVIYGGLSFRVPADWPVFDLASDPTRCVRFDRHAVYLGSQGPQADCPAGAVGRTEAVQIQAVSSVAVPPHWGAMTLSGGVPVRLASGTGMAGEVVARLPRQGVVATITYGADPALTHMLLASFAPAPGKAPPAAPRSTPAADSHPAPGSASQSGALAPGIYDGLGFDACTAPSTSTMSSWLSSPYRSLGVYVGGVNRACSQPNLTSSWVSTVENQGWRLVPTYVGRQAPCAFQGGMVTIGANSGDSQGTNAADDAVTQAAALGMGHGTPIYFDMEAYSTTNASCDKVVMQFVSAWTDELRRKGYVPGLYSSAASGIAQQSANYDSTTYSRPNDIWIGDWNGVQSVFGDPYVPDTQWPNHQRLHQYQGGHDETYGGVTINIDSDVNDGVVAGEGRPIVFDSNRTGNREIFLIGPDGVGATQLTANGADNFAPSLSPDGTQVAFTSTMGGNDDVWIMNVNGTNLRQLTGKPGFDGYPSWSPGGKRIAFQSDRASNQDVYTIRESGTGLTQLTYKSATDERPTWSPGGTRRRR